MNWPPASPSWLLPWAIWRFRGQEGSRPAGTPKTIPKWAWGFLKWCEWRRKGARPPRPDGLPVRIPQWAWGELKLLNQAVPVKPPPPPPPPPPPVIADSWRLPFPIMFTAWGWRTEWTHSAAIEAQCARMADAMRGGTVALQIGQAGPAVAQALRDHGFKVAAWGVAGQDDARALADLRAEGYVVQIEGLHEYNVAIDSLRAGVGDGLSIATVTTYAGLEDPPQMDALIAAGCTHLFPEVYAQTGGNRGDVGVMMNQAKIYGAPYAHPTIGLYWYEAEQRYVDLAEYDLSGWGRKIGAWVAETMRPEDWAALKAL